MLKHKSIISTILFVILFGINACNSNEPKALTPAISEETAKQIITIAAIVQANPDVSSNILAQISDIAGNGAKNLRAKADDIDADTKNAMEEFQKDPNRVLTTIANEGQGAQKISLLEGLFTQKDAQTLEKRAEVFTPIDIPTNVTGFVIPNSPNLRLLDCSFDCRMHIMAGACVAMGVSAIALRNVSWFTPWVKAALLVAVGISAGIAVGAAKEAYDKYFSGGKGTPEWRDFWNTALGSAAGGAVSWGISVLISTPLGTSVALGVGSAIIGFCPALYFFSGGKKKC